MNDSHNFCYTMCLIYIFFAYSLRGWIEELGYHAVAFGTYGDSVELVGTSSALKCCTSPIIQYLNAVLVAGMW